MDLSYFELEDGTERIRPIEKSLGDVERVIGKHIGTAHKAINITVDLHIETLQWQWLDEYKLYQDELAQVIEWNSSKAGTVAYVKSVATYSDDPMAPPTYTEVTVLHEAKQTPSEPVRPPIQSADEWMASNIGDEHLKLIGFNFQGVMCSATESDQNGLLGMYQFIKSGQLSPNFKFENGARLPLNSGNIDALMAAFHPFRSQFF